MTWIIEQKGVLIRLVPAFLPAAERLGFDISVVQNKNKNQLSYKNLHISMNYEDIILYNSVGSIYNNWTINTQCDIRLHFWLICIFLKQRDLKTAISSQTSFIDSNLK